MSDNKEALFDRFDEFCGEFITKPLAELYTMIADKNSLVRALFKLVITPPTRVNIGIMNKSGWEYRDYNVMTLTKKSGTTYIQLYSKSAPETLIFSIKQIRMYNKLGERIYSCRLPDRRLKIDTETCIIADLLDYNTHTIRRFVFNEITAQPVAALLDYVKSCDYYISITPTVIRNYADVPTDFVITYGAKQIHVHKFALACLSEYFIKITYGTGNVPPTNTLDLSAFCDQTVEWFAKFIYDPKITLDDMSDDDWALFDYVGIDVNAILRRACVEMCVLE